MSSTQNSDNVENIQDAQEIPASTEHIADILELGEVDSWVPTWMRWCNTSRAHIRDAEKEILCCVKSPIHLRYVEIGPIVGSEDCFIWTASLNENSQELPLVMLHGLASGIGLWARNLDELSQSRPVHAIDVLGFGQSSRPNFSTEAPEVEHEFVEALEAWRKAMKLEKFILLGHSLGAYLSLAYTYQYSSRVVWLILTDPWGFSHVPERLSHIGKIPIHHQCVVKLMEPFNPLSVIRAAGPLGRRIIQKVRADLIKNYEGLIEDHDYKISNYIYHCNVQNPTGESAFHALMEKFGWSKRPMCERIQNSLDERIPLTLLYGSKSWVDHYPVDLIRLMRPNSFIDFHTLEDAGHHVYADKADEFNTIVINACFLADTDNARLKSLESSAGVLDTNENHLTHLRLRLTS